METVSRMPSVISRYLQDHQSAERILVTNCLSVSNKLLSELFISKHLPLLSELLQVGHAEDEDVKAGPGQGEDDPQAGHHQAAQLEEPSDAGESGH